MAIDDNLGSANRAAAPTESSLVNLGGVRRVGENQPPPSPEHSKVEQIKWESRFLRGNIANELLEGTDHFAEDSVQLLKHHGMYQQDDRDARAELRGQGDKSKSYMMMLRTRVPGGKMTAEQFLGEMELGDALGNGTMRLTSRQAIQHHGILKENLKTVMQRIHQLRLSTLGACGDVNRNVMCSPLPIDRPCYHQVQALADKLSDYFLPQSNAYFEIWLKDMQSGEQECALTMEPEHEPIYGAVYLPRKFKTAIAFSFDNGVDVLTNDLALIAIVEQDHVVGYNVMVGGGMGMTPAKKTTFAALALPLCFATPEQVVAVCRAVIEVQRDFGNREDRKHARLKYLIRDWGIEKFREHVAQYWGQALTPTRDVPISDAHDALGWIDQENGLWCYGLNVENGRIVDRPGLQLKSALRELVSRLKPAIRLTAQQSVMFCDLTPEQKPVVEEILVRHGIKLSEDYLPTRRWSMACVAWPTCGLSITESERALPGIMDQFELQLQALGLADQPIHVRMTGCPNGCARPYNAEIGLVGKAKEKYTVYLGGSHLGTRLAFLYKDMVPADQIVPELTKVLQLFQRERANREHFGDFCHRFGAAGLQAVCGA
ncbi:MAG: NADPH-dependent assimilatory sulfite reductase hemoprotein subunit [Planctomycetaceae bacterium]|nr:NADPH-dependent assimilatory sulfite reductase hemoprotein subunit [Planctomycetaceae bacterium]